jgi:DNA ligase-1
MRRWFIAYDLLEHGADLRDLPQHERRARLEAAVLQGTPLRLSPLVRCRRLAALAALRASSRASAASKA